MRLLLFVVCVCWLACRPATADDGAEGFQFDDVELLPMSEHEWQLLHSENLELFGRVEAAYYERQGLRERLAEDGASAWLRAELKNAEAAWRERYAGMVALLAKHGVAADAFRRICVAPRVVARVERFAHAQILGLRLTEAQRRLFERVVHAVDAAHVVLSRPPRIADAGTIDEDRVIELVRNANEHRRWEIEHRMWRLVDYLLDAEQKRALRVRLPMRYRNWDDLFAHAGQIPGLTLGQAARVRAAKASFEADVGPDEALIPRLERELEGDVPDASREAKEIELHQANVRIARAHRDALKRLRAILGDAFSRLLAVPPQIAPEERREEPASLFAGVAFDDAQIARLAKISAEFRTLRERHERALAVLERELDEIGPDSPQMRAMEMKQAGMAGELNLQMLVLMGEVFRDVMSLDQVVAWVLQAPEED